MTILTSFQGYVFIIAFGLGMILLSLYSTGNKHVSGEQFLVFDRKVPWFMGAFSIAASWAWAPAFLVSSQMTYTRGLPGMFWFCVPNILTIMLFVPLALRIRRILPNGYTLPQFIKKRYDSKVHIVYLVSFISLQICSVGTQVLGGAAIIHWLTGIQFTYIALLIGLSTCVYTMISGLKASILTDFVQMLMIIIICIVVVPWAVFSSGGLSAIKAGIGGLSGEYTNILNWEVAYTFGIIATIGWLAGLLADQQHWQRTFAIRHEHLKKSFIYGAAIFAIIPVSLCLLGFIAADPANSSWNISSPQLTGIVTISNLLPAWVSILFAVMLISGLVSTYDSALCAGSSLLSIDIYKTYFKPDASEEDILKVARYSILMLTILGTGIALIPGVQILHLFLFYGTMRVATFIPTILSLFWEKTNKTAVFYATLSAMIVGVPLFAYGSIIKNTDIKMLACLLVLFMSSAISIFVSLLKPETFDYNTL